MCLPYFTPYPKAIASATALDSAVASVTAPMSLNNSLELLPSMAVPLTLRKSSSATPLVNLGTLLLDIPVDKVAVVVIAVPLSVMASASNVPSISTLPDISRLAAAISPLAVNEVMFGLAPDPARLAHNLLL